MITLSIANFVGFGMAVTTADSSISFFLFLNCTIQWKKFKKKMSSYSNVKMLNLHYKFLKKYKQTYLRSLVFIKNNLRMINTLLFFKKNDPAVLYCYVFMVILSRYQIKNFRNNKQKMHVIISSASIQLGSIPLKFRLPLQLGILEHITK